MSKSSNGVSVKADSSETSTIGSLLSSLFRISTPKGSSTISTRGWARWVRRPLLCFVIARIFVISLRSDIAFEGNWYAQDDTDVLPGTSFSSLSLPPLTGLGLIFVLTWKFWITLPRDRSRGRTLFGFGKSKFRGEERWWNTFRDPVSDRVQKKLLLPSLRIFPLAWFSGLVFVSEMMEIGRSLVEWLMRSGGLGIGWWKGRYDDPSNRGGLPGDNVWHPLILKTFLH